MILSNLIKKLDTVLPKTLSEEWDNDGNMFIADINKDISKVLITLDVTPDAVDYAVKIGADLIISHHPLIFKPLKNLDNNSKTSIILTLAKNGISVLSYHTRFDNAEGGMNDALAEKLGILNPEPLEVMARIGMLSESVSPEEFSALVSAKLSTNVILYSANKEISRVAVLGGGGKDFVLPARIAGADAIVTGDVSYSVALEESFSGITIVDAGHFGTEKIFTEAFPSFIEKSGISDVFIDTFSPDEFATFVLKEF